MGRLAHRTRLLVTGGAGFIGSAFVRHVRATTEAQVTVLDKLTYAADPGYRERAQDLGVELVIGDVTDAELLDELVGRADVVVHFAAETHNDNSLADPRPFLDTNVVGTFELLEAVRRHGVHLHHVSTDEVFGDLDLADPERFTETTPYRPSSPYSSTKAASDLLVRAWVRSYGISATLSNCSNNYGPYQHVEKFIPRQITNLLLGEPIRLYGTGEQVRDWIHVADHADAVLRVIDAGKAGETYLIGADGERSNLDVARILLELMVRDEQELVRVTDRPGHDRRYAIDATRLRSELGWVPAHASLQDGLAETVDWYRTHRDWWEGAKAATEAGYARRERVLVPDAAGPGPASTPPGRGTA